MIEPLHIVSLGAGVQSSTMALMAAAGEITPMPHCAIFADTKAEPEGVYRWLEWLEKQLPFPVYRVTKGSLSEAALAVRKSKGGDNYTNSNVPVFLKTNGRAQEGIQMRQCTKDFKIDVISKEVRKLAAEAISAWRSLKRVVGAENIMWRSVEQWIGISRDEVMRMKPSRLDYINHRWPLIERSITRSGCIAWMKTNGFPEPPRSSCVFCPYHSNSEWLRLKKEEPEEFERAAKFEDSYQITFSQIQRRKAVPFLHRSLVPLRDVDFRTSDEKTGQLNMFNNECEGMCGV